MKLTTLATLALISITFTGCSSESQTTETSSAAQTQRRATTTPKPVPTRRYTTADRQAAYRYWTHTVVPYGISYAAMNDMQKQIAAQNMDGINSDLAAMSKSAHLLKVAASENVPSGWSDVEQALSQSADHLYSGATAMQHGIATNWVDQSDQDTAKSEMSASADSWKTAYDAAKDHFSLIGGNPNALPDFNDAAKGIQNLQSE